jgi:hypothetical protein
MEVIQGALEKKPPCEAWFNHDKKPFANNKEANRWNVMVNKKRTQN